MRNFLVYDIEILRAIPPKDGRLVSGIEYCEGWHDHARMGVACICAYASWTGRYYVFLHDNIEDLAPLERQSDLLVGFDNVKFDDNVMLYEECKLAPDVPRYDILLEAWAGAGLGPDYHAGSHSGFGLNDMAMVNFGIGKTGSGGYAPILWKKGRRGGVIDYCLNDVYLTLRLFERVQNDGFLLHPKEAKGIITMRTPWP